MRCSKCGYISFDYNQVCPKCNREISADQAKLNLPAFRPDPPYLLGALTGEPNESNVGFSIDADSAMGAQDDLDTDLEDSVIMTGGGLGLDDEEDIEMSLDDEDTGEFEDTGEEVITESVSDFDTEDDEEEISLDMDDFSAEQSDSGEIAPLEPAQEEEELAVDFDEVSLDDSQDIAKDEVELDLDELEVAETGELEIDTPDVPDEPLDKDDEIEIDLDTISIEEQDDDMEVSVAEDEELAVDLEDLDLDLDLEKNDD